MYLPVFSAFSDVINYNFTMISRVWSAVLQLTKWLVESMPAFIYCSILVFVTLVLALIPAVIIYRGVAWLRKGGLKYEAIRRAQKRNSAR